MSQYGGGPGRPTGSDDYGYGGGSGHDGGDDDRYTQPFAEQGDPDPYDSERTPFGYQPEERYWTDYLRIAAPVVGVILMLGLVWFWVANMLDDDNGEVAVDDTDNSGPVLPTETPDADADDAVAEDDDPLAVNEPDDEDGEGEEGESGEAPTTIGPGATVVVVGTDEAGLNMRASASTEAEIIGSYADGTVMTITGEAQEADGFTWWPVDVEGETGFVAEDFLELSEETEAEEPAPEGDVAPPEEEGEPEEVETQ